MIISIQTSTSQLSFTLFNDNSIINHRTIYFNKELSEIIVPKIKMFLQDNSISFNDISYLAIGCGPGSFTGIRSIISTALGITISHNHIKSIGVNSLAGLAMSVLDEAKNLKLNYIVSSIDSKTDDIFIQSFKINYIKNNALPFVISNDIDTIKIENLYNYFVVNNLILKDVLFVGHNHNIAKKIINLNVSQKLAQYPDSLGVGKLASYLIINKIAINKTTFASNKFKPVYVRPAQINIK